MKKVKYESLFCTIVENLICCISLYLQKIKKPEVLYEEVVEVDEKLVLVQEKCGVNYQHHGVVTGKSDVKVKKYKK